MAQASPGKLDRLHRTPAESTALAFDGTGLCASVPARPTKDASYSVSVRQVAALLHTSRPWLENGSATPSQDQEHSDERHAHQSTAPPHDRRHEPAQVRREDTERLHRSR